MEFRKNDTEPNSGFRTERLYEDVSGWHYMTREGFVGPFNSAFEATQALAIYKNDLASLPSFQDWRNKNACEPVTQASITIDMPRYLLFFAKGVH